MTNGFPGLPSRPVTGAETRALDQHSSFDFCHPIYHLVDDPESIVVIILKKDDHAYFLFFNSTSQQWERLIDTTTPESVTDEIPFEEEIIEERLNPHYDQEDLKPAGYPWDPVEGSIHNFPSQPLTDEQIKQMQERHPMINEVMPLVRTADGSSIIAGIFFFDDLIEEQRVTTAVGYEPEAGEWELIASAESADPQLDESLAGLETAYAHWVDAHYTMDMIQPIESPEEAIE